MTRKALKASQRETVQFEAEWTRSKLAELLDRLYVVEQLYYLSLSETDAREPFEKALRRLGEDGKQISEEATVWGLGKLSQPSEALIGLRLTA